MPINAVLPNQQRPVNNPSQRDPIHRNFPSIALDILQETNLSTIFSAVQMDGYCFYLYCWEGFVYLVMVDTRGRGKIGDFQGQGGVVVRFFKDVQQQFYNKYSEDRRNSAITFSLKQFSRNLKQTMNHYNTLISTLTSPNSHKPLIPPKLPTLSAPQLHSLHPLHKKTDKTTKISVIAKASEQTAHEAYQFSNTPIPNSVIQREKEKKRKILVGVGVGVGVVVVVVVVIVVVLVVMGK